jgi:protocatechuate 3,4-dioxygenase beta subunit
MNESPGAVQSVPDRKRIAMVAALVVCVLAAAAGLWRCSVHDASHRNQTKNSARDAGVKDSARDGGGRLLLPAGPAALHGTVVDASAQPIAGVQITVAPEKGSDPAREGETSKDGSFAIEGLAVGVYRVTVEGAAVVAAEVRRVDVPGEALTIMVARRVLIEGVVTDENAPAVGASVEIAGPSIEAPRVVTAGKDGRFLFDDLPEGEYTLSARRGARAAGGTQVERFGVGPWPSLALALGPAAVVEGKVVDQATHAPIAAARVWLTAEDGPARLAESAADGTFTIEGVLPGAWSVDAIAPGYLAPSAAGLEVAAGQTLSLELPMARGAVVSGRVVDAHGDPIAGARIEVEGEGKDGRAVLVSQGARARRYARAYGTVAADDPGASARPRTDYLPLGELGVTMGAVPFAPPRGVRVGQVREASAIAKPGAPGAGSAADGPTPGAAATEAASAGLVTDAAGVFRVDSLPPGRFVVRATHPEFAGGQSGQVVVAAGAHVDGVKVVLVRGATVAGRVLDASGVSAPGARVTAWQGEALVATTFADETGRYELQRLSGKLVLRAADEHGGEGEAALELGAADDGHQVTRDLHLGASGGTLEGTIVDPSGGPVGGVRVSVVGRGAGATSDGDGRFTLVNLPAGELQLDLAHPDWPRTRVGPYVAGARQVKLTLRAGGGVEGLLRDAQSRGRIASFTLRAEGPGDDSRAQAHKAGEFELSSLTPGRWTLTFAAPGFASKTIEVDVPAGRGPRAVTVPDLRVELARGATIAGTVYDRHGDVARAASVECGGVRATTDKLGRYRLYDVPTGDVTVVATQAAGGRGEKKVAVRPGDEVLTLDVRLE